MSQILVLGCGWLAWGQPRESPLVGRQWATGRLEERVFFGPDGFRWGEVSGSAWVTLADEVEDSVGWRPVRPAGSEPKVQISSAAESAPLYLPNWRELVGEQARWTTAQLKGDGVLIAPFHWQNSPRGRELLGEWEGLGWRVVPLEEAVRRHLADEKIRVVSASPTWLRLSEPGQSMVLPNGLEAARALELGPKVVDRILASLPGDLSTQWREEERDATGWFLRQQVTRAIMTTLKSGSSRFEMGGDACPLFAFSSAKAKERFGRLSALRISVEIPPLPSSIWWQEVAAAGCLEDPGQTRKSEAIAWGALKTALVDGPDVAPVDLYLSLHGLPRVKVDPAKLVEGVPRLIPALEPETGQTQESVVSSISTTRIPGGDVDGRARAVGSMPPETPEPEVGGAPLKGALETWSLAAEGREMLASLLPERLVIRLPHRPNQIRVQIDGKTIGQENLRRIADHGEAGREYQIDGVPVGHGSIVRIDFEEPMH